MRAGSSASSGGLISSRPDFAGPNEISYGKTGTHNARGRRNASYEAFLPYRNEIAWKSGSYPQDSGAQNGEQARRNRGFTDFETHAADCDNTVIMELIRIVWMRELHSGVSRGTPDTVPDLDPVNIQTFISKTDLNFAPLLKTTDCRPCENALRHHSSSHTGLSVLNF